jgi:hypothetical protein
MNARKSNFMTLSRCRKAHNKIIAVIALSLMSAAGAEAGQGWYLLYPGPSSGKALGTWNHYGAYSTVEACEEAKTFFYEQSQKYKDSKDDSVKAIYQAALEARCIASDDPRLEEEKGEKK